MKPSTNSPGRPSPHVAALANQILALVAPPPTLTVAEWSDAERILSPEASAEPGRWRTDRAPFQRGILESITDPGTSRVVLMTSSQVGKTEILLNVIGYHAHQDPAPILMILPTLELAESFSKDRLAPMIRDTPALRDLIDVRSRDSGNTLLHKTFPGGHWTGAGANAAASLSSRPVRIVLCDEVDRYPASAGTEGDPVSLAIKRTATFWNRKAILTSTPTIRGASRIESAWEESDQRRFEVPCPRCGSFQPLAWSQVKFQREDQEKPSEDLVEVPKPEDRGRSARVVSVWYECRDCRQRIEESEKPSLLERGIWTPSTDFRGTAGFHLNALYSPWSRWIEIVSDFLESRRDPETLKVWVNTTLGETWEETGEKIDENSLLARREAYGAEVPDYALVLTAGVDVQDDRLEVEVVGWTEGEESWGIDYRVLYGDPDQTAVWSDLDALLSTTYERRTGQSVPISATCVDSGAHTAQVYRYVLGKTARRIFATKGIAGAGRPIVSAPMARRHGRNRRPVPLFLIGTDEAKGLLFSRLQRKEPGPGFCHFPAIPAYDDEHFRQLTAEKAVPRYHRGFMRREWIKVRARNEALDARILALAALYILNPIWEALKRNAPPTDPDGPETPPPPPPPPRPAPVSVLIGRRPGRPGRPRGTW